jgi:ornithine carbamoyltransferase
MTDDFLALTDFESLDLVSLMDLADSLRTAWVENRMPQNLQNKNIALLWDAEGFRNRVAFELGIAAMGGRAVQVPGKLDIREPIEDIARYIQNWFHCIVARTQTHDHIRRLAAAANIPVINARTDFNHPCEVLGDLVFIRTVRKTLSNLKVVFVGEATNLCHPWFEAAARLPIRVIQACPEGFQINNKYLAMLRQNAAGTMQVSHDLDESLKDADVIYTDCWPKRSTQDEKEMVRKLFEAYQITKEKLGLAKPDCLFLPCPPVTRGEEVSAEVMELSGQQVYNAKEYLLHAQNAVLTTLLRGTSVKQGK